MTEKEYQIKHLKALNDIHKELAALRKVFEEWSKKFNGNLAEETADWNFDSESEYYICSKCGTGVYDVTKFCPECGRKMLW